MADNTTVSNAPDSDNPDYVVKADDVGTGVLVQYVKLDAGADGASDPVTDANPLPVEDTAVAALLNSKIATEATAANQVTEIAHLATIAGAVRAEDTGASTGDSGIANLGYVNTNAATLTSNEGDYGNISINSKGAQHIDINTDFRQSAGKSILKQEDIAHASGDAGVMMLGVANVTASSFAADGDYTPIAVAQHGAVFVDVRRTQQVSDALSLLKAEDSASASGDAGVLALTIKQSNSPSVLSDTAGDYQGIGTNDYGAVYVDINSNHRTNANASIVKVRDVASNSSDAGVMIFGVRNDLGATNLSGSDADVTPLGLNARGAIYADSDTAHDGVDKGNPVKIGYRARTANITAVAQDDRVDGIADPHGRNLVQGSLTGTRFKGRNASLITNTTSTSLIAAGGAGVIYVITAITVSNSSASVGTEVNILDGSTVVWGGPAAAVYGGYSITFPDGLVCTANTAINAQCVTTGASVRACVTGHKIT